MGIEAAHNIAKADQSEWIHHDGVACLLADQACRHRGKIDKSSKKIQKMRFGKQRHHAGGLIEGLPALCASVIAPKGFAASMTKACSSATQVLM